MAYQTRREARQKRKDKLNKKEKQSKWAEARKTHANAYKPWTTIDEVSLKNEFRNFCDINLTDRYKDTLEQGAPEKSIPVLFLNDNKNFYVFINEMSAKFFRSKLSIISRLAHLGQLNLIHED